MKRKIIAVCVLSLALGSYAAAGAKTDNTVSFDNAIQSAARNIRDKLGVDDGSPVIAILNFTSPSESLSAYVVDELTLMLADSSRFVIVDRQRLDVIRREENFQLSGEVSDTSAQQIGAKLGAEYVVSGALIEMGDFYRFRIMALNVKTAAVTAPTLLNVAHGDRQVAFLLGSARTAAVRAAAEQAEKERQAEREQTEKEQAQAKAKQEEQRRKFKSGLAGFFGNKHEKFGGIGVAVGSSFASPYLIGSVFLRLPPAPYTYFEFGCDIGVFAGPPIDITVDYYSLYPYGHFNAYVPFYDDPFGFHIGLGAGYMMANYTFPSYDKVEVTSLALDAVAGFNLGNWVDISYTMRTNFKTMNHKATVGVTYRFNKK
jgi:TolB-like protein